MTALEKLHDPQECRPLPHNEAVRRASENNTSVDEEQRREGARLQSAELLPKRAKKLDEAQRKLDEQQANLHAERQLAEQIVLEWERLQHAAKALAKRVQSVAQFAENNKAQVADFRRVLRDQAGSETHGTWVQLFVPILNGEAGQKLIESTLAEVRETHAAKQAELLDFAKKHGLPEYPPPTNS